jgi:hypothetical protein
LCSTIKATLAFYKLMKLLVASSLIALALAGGTPNDANVMAHRVHSHAAPVSMDEFSRALSGKSESRKCGMLNLAS